MNHRRRQRLSPLGKFIDLTRRQGNKGQSEEKPLPENLQRQTWGIMDHVLHVRFYNETGRIERYYKSQHRPFPEDPPQYGPFEGFELELQ